MIRKNLFMDQDTRYALVERSPIIAPYYMDIDFHTHKKDRMYDTEFIIETIKRTNYIVKNNFCFTGEVGLSGEIRAVNRIEQRIAEADKLGFEKIFISSFHKVGGKGGMDLSKLKIEVCRVSKVEDLIRLLL